jgi:IclR family transcriptional regulator, pca regulon regulatory protein
MQKGLRTVAAQILGRECTPVAALSFTIEATRMPIDSFVAEAAPTLQRLKAS